MSVTAVSRQQTGTVKTFKTSGGDGAITLGGSVTNGLYQQSTKVDFGATFGQLYAIYADLEFATAPTAGNTVSFWLNPSSSSTAGTDNRGGCAGTDSAYTGYSSNAAASILQLMTIGDFVCTAQATTTIQKAFIGFIRLPQRYCSIVALNGSGVTMSLASSATVITFVPIEYTSEPS